MSLLRLTQQVAEAFLPNPPDVIGVAVSGGGDSMALLHLMHGFCALHGCKLHAVTVDHGLRPEAQAEAQMVNRTCAGLGVSHDILHWQDWDGSGNLQSEARDARYALMADWARGLGLCTVALGHTADDQAETFVMRLARRAGVDGLSGMPRRMVRNGITWVRPLLAASRESLRDHLRAQQITWAEDPSNDDCQFERVRVRKTLAHLAELGIDASVLSDVSVQMDQARRALSWQTFMAAREIVEIDAGAVVIPDRQLRILPDDIQRRLIVQAISWISKSDYPPRRAAVATVMQALRKGQAGTLDGVHLCRVAGRIWIFREWNAVRDVDCAPSALWDTRWRVWPLREEAATGVDLRVRALGAEGLRQCGDWRDTGRPYDVLTSTPALWQDDRLVAAPLAGQGDTWHAQIDGGPETFFAALLTH